MPPRRNLFYLLLILLMAAAGRILNIADESLWVDEGFSYWAIRHPDMLGLLVNDVHPPVYFVLLRGWAEVAGITELALRYLSVVPSLLSVAAVVHVAREIELIRGINRETWVPTLAALMLALADMENYVAQETRMYTWHVLWVILSMWGFLRWARTGERRALIGWFMASLLLVYTHYIGTAALAVQGLYALFFLKDRTRLIAVATLSIIGVLFVPWLLAVVADQTANVGTGFNVPSTLASLWDWRDEWFTQQWALLGGLALLGAAVPVYKAHPPKRWPTAGLSALLLAWVVVPVAGAYVLNLSTPILMDYRLTQITPAVALLIAFGLGAIPRNTQIFLVAVIVVYGLAIDDTPRPRPPWREVGANVALYAAPGDLALAHVTPSGDWQVMYYYERFLPADVETRSLRQWQLEQFYGSRYENGLPDLLTEYDHVWLMHWSKDTSAFDFLAATGHQITAVIAEDWLGNDLNVYRFDLLPETPVTAYENGLILHNTAFHADDMRLDLWWGADAPINADYTVSAQLLAADGRLIAQHDSGPFNNARPTSSIQPGEVVYDPHLLTLADGIDTIAPGEYTLSVKVYQWTPDTGIIDQVTLDGETVVTVGAVAF